MERSDPLLPMSIRHEISILNLLNVINERGVRFYESSFKLKTALPGKKTTNKNNQNQQVNITPCNGRFCDPALVSL